MSRPTIFFDLDGTLVDSVHDVHLCLNSVLKENDRDQLSLATVTNLVGGGAWTMVEVALNMTGGKETDNQVREVVEGFLRRYRDNPVRLSKMFPGIADLLEMLQNEGMQMAICTNKPRVTTDPVMAYFDLNKYFSLVRCGDEVPYKKPDRRHITDMMCEMDLNTRDVIMVGDSHNDICAAHAAGVRSIAVTYGYDLNLLNLVELDLVANSVPDIQRSLNEIWSK